MSTTKLRHVVLFGFKAGAGATQVDELIKRFGALKDKVPGIEAFEWGVNSSPEGKAEGHTHCFVLTFENEAARDAYLPHPEHAAFVNFARPLIEKSLVVDYWAS